MSIWIDTEFGEFAFRLLDTEGDGHVDLSFVAQQDEMRSRVLLSRTRMLRLQVLRKHDGSEQDERVSKYSFFAYLGSDPENGSDATDELAFFFTLPTDVNGVTLWRTRESQAYEFKKNYWSAAAATLTICSDSGRVLRRADRSTPVQTKISLGFDDPWWEGLFFQALDDLSRDQGTISADITSPLQLQAILRKAEREAQGSEALELHYRLKLLLPAYENLLKEIVARPAQRPQHRVRLHVLERATAASFHREQGRGMQFGSVSRVVRAGAAVIPLSFHAVESELRPDPLAGQFVRWSLQLVDRWMRKVEESIASFSDRRKEDLARLRELDPRGWESSYQAKKFRSEIAQHDAAVNTTRQLRHRLRQFRSLLPRDTVASGSGFSLQDSAVLSFDVRYSELRRLTLQLLQVLNYTEYSLEAFPFEVEPWNVLYERWCFMRVLEALEKIGFRREDGADRLVTPFYRRPLTNQVNCVLVHDDLAGQRVEVWSERRYPDARQAPKFAFGLETRPERTSYEPIESNNLGRAKRTPDIALEFYSAGSEVPRIVTLDPTIAATHAAEKYEYREAIRSFFEIDENDGQSRRIVEAAWAIVPGHQMASSFLQPGDQYRTGRLVLRPDADGRSTRELPNALAKIFYHTGISRNLLHPR